MAVLQDLSQANAEIAALRAQIEAMRANSQSKLTCKVSEKGALCVYGLGRFPVTLYASQWERLLDHADAIRAFAAANASTLVRKA
jgi:hypothetical protein